MYGPDESGYEIPQLMFMAGPGKCVAGLNVYKSCDFDRDGEITEADLDFFEIQLNKSAPGSPVGIPSYYDADYFDYLKADLNGSGRVVHALTKSEAFPDRQEYDLGNVAVTAKDAEVLYQFVLPGNTNLDDKVDMLDFIAFSANFLTGPEMHPDWSQGDFDFDDDVDMDDLLLLLDSWLRYDD